MEMNWSMIVWVVWGRLWSAGWLGEGLDLGSRWSDSSTGLHGSEFTLKCCWETAGLRQWPALVIRVFPCRTCCSCFWYFTTKLSIDQLQRIFCSFFFAYLVFLFFFLHRTTEKWVRLAHNQLQISLESSTTKPWQTRQVICAYVCFYLV